VRTQPRSRCPSEKSDCYVLYDGCHLPAHDAPYLSASGPPRARAQVWARRRAFRRSAPFSCVMDTLRVRQWLTTALEGDSSPMVVASIHASRTDTPLAGDFSRLAYQNHNAYCARWGYRYLALSETMLGRRRCLGNGVACLTPHAKMDLRLLKVPFLRELLSQPAAKLVFWCDYDSVFTNLEVPLHTLAPAKDLGFAGATCGLLNAGHLFVRPTSWTMQLLSVVEQTQGKNRAEKCPGQEGLTDNAAFRFHLGRGNCSIGLLDASSAAGCEQSMASLDPEMQAHVACIPCAASAARQPRASPSRHQLPPPSTRTRAGDPHTPPRVRVAGSGRSTRTLHGLTTAAAIAIGSPATLFCTCPGHVTSMSRTFSLRG